MLNKFSFALVLLLLFASAAQAAMLDHTKRAQEDKLALLQENTHIVQKYAEFGVQRQQALAKLAMLTDQELLELSKNIDSAPQGQGFVSVFMLVFATLVVTDSLGYTDLFPFVPGPSDN